MARPGLKEGLHNLHRPSYIIDPQNLILKSKVTHTWCMNGRCFKVTKNEDWIQIDNDMAWICLGEGAISYNLTSMRYTDHISKSVGKITESEFLQAFNSAYKKLWNRK